MSKPEKNDLTEKEPVFIKTSPEELTASDERTLNRSSDSEEFSSDLLRLGRTMRLLESFSKDDFDMAVSMLEDFSQASKALAPFTSREKVVIFGSARIDESSPLYASVKELAAMFAASGFVVITGGGPGVMSAGLEGAGPGNALGISVNLPFESPAAFPNVPVVRQRRFFTRKLAMVRKTKGVIVVPGGFGTMDEAFEVLTLLQTGKKSPTPVVFLDPENTGFFDSLIEFISRAGDDGFISKHDTSLFSVCSSEREAFSLVQKFWSNYKKFEGVDGSGLISLKKELSPETLSDLSETYPPFAPFVQESSKDREPVLRFCFDRRNFGLLRKLIDSINDSKTL